ncbi:hypothetical protein COV42_01450 [Candidatus Campbellbacteria bacterium CG11_big_fil_rev_8_21_14_0_20_44_21]|uniref:AI-2E family transporter n=1 Tax=Candidatus Campbellbacteria bacterium CG22_combo_CG10-13_8_21_14_all_43_18 TaxID=1974530 RepID=A0A2H0DVS8_9BACT|nr:MAG: hypothetical protein COW82_02930 [Candidatus Campbellbacteria bacterium CG22_combo_CG10-13_8_21_14_all_43_18]PIR24302.1 MAG: hypothetical protein COV42_01450 [Candidatus Campbellbacteria bacterium CG11_big_fil_rev_8_21_14_0_20_44_21]
MKEGKTLSINITTGTFIKGILTILLFLGLYIFRDLVLVILAAIVIASAIEPAVNWLKRRKVPRLLSVILIYLLLAVIFVALFYSFIPPLFREVSNFVNNLPTFVNSIDFWSPVSGKDLGILNPAVQNISDNLSLQDLINQFQKIIGNVTEGFWKTVSVIFGGALSFVLIIVLSFYLAVQKNGIDNFLRVIAPAGHQNYIIDLWRRSQKKIGFWMQGQLVLALIIGILSYLGLAVLNIKYAFLLAVLAGLFELIPLFGPILSAIPAIILGFAQGGATLGLVVMGLYVIIQQFENHLIFPLVVKKVTGLPAIFVILSLIVGGRLAGFLGIILSVPIATVIMEFISDIETENKKILEKQIAKEAK